MFSSRVEGNHNTSVTRGSGYSNAEGMGLRHLVLRIDNGAFERLVDKPSATSKMINDRPVGSNVRRFHRDALEKAVQIASTPWN